MWSFCLEKQACFERSEVDEMLGLKGDRTCDCFCFWVGQSFSTIEAGIWHAECFKRPLSLPFGLENKSGHPCDPCFPKRRHLAVD